MGFRQIVQGCKLIAQIQSSLYLFRLFCATIVISQNSLDNQSKRILANHLQSGEVDLVESGRLDHSEILMEQDTYRETSCLKGVESNGDDMQNTVGSCANVSKVL